MDLKEASGLITAPQTGADLLVNHDYRWTITAGDKQVILFKIHWVRLIGLNTADSDETLQVILLLEL